MIREIVFDTETTGFNPKDGHKLVEIGAVELINHLPTGRTYHQYVNPQRDVPEDSFKVHGLTYEFLKGYPCFKDVVDEFLAFIGEDACLVAHNAMFDMGFINAELENVGKQLIESSRFIDTLDIAKKLFPGARNNLDALCRRFNIDNSDRTKHGALIDSELLAKVYLELLGGEEPSMDFSAQSVLKEKASISSEAKVFRPSRHFEVSAEELAEHETFLSEKLKDAVWIAE